MKSSGATLLLASVLAVSAPLIAGSEAVAQENDRNAQSREPFKIFDNLYYVGIDFVSAYLVTTSDGLILIDSLFAESADTALANVRKLGFDPSDIEYVLISHGHADHAGGAPRIKEVTGARVGMAQGDWEMVRGSIEPGPDDLVIEDDTTLTLGDTTIHLYVTPGHTPGVVSMRFTVKDGMRRHRAFMFGGMGLNFTGVERTEMYLESVRRVREMGEVEVNLTNHQGAGRIFERADRLARRQPGDPHPFVARSDFNAWLDELEQNAEAKLSEETSNRRE